MIFLMELKYSEIENILDVKYIVASSVSYTQPPGIDENSDPDLMLKTLLPNGVRVKITNDGVRVKITNDDIRLRSNSNTNKTINFSKKRSFFTILGFTQSLPVPLGDTQGFVQKLPGTYKSVKPMINITGND